MMNLERIESKIEELRTGKSKLCEILEKQCWKIKDPEKSKKVITPSRLDLPDTWAPLTKTEKNVKLIPDDFLLKYRIWYSTGKGLLEGNHDKESLEEYEGMYRNIQGIAKEKYVAENDQHEIIKFITHQLHIIESIPKYIEGKSYHFKLILASTLLGDELKEARYLFNQGFYRASGALAGVILERHLKLKFDESKPKIKYGEKASLVKIIYKAE